MIRPRSVIIAETVIQDRNTNRMSVINISEQFRSQGYPLLIGRFTVFTIIERDSMSDPQDVQGQLRIKLDEEILFEQQIEVSFGNTLMNRNVLQFQGFVVPHPGTLIVSVQIGDQILESYRISVMPGPPLPPQQI